MFSIIVPVHNVEDYIDECIKSIIMQSYRKFELILVVNALMKAIIFVKIGK